MSIIMDHLPIIIAVVVVLLVILAIFKSGWRVAESNEALIISGRKKKKDAAVEVANVDESMQFRIVTGTGTLVIPGVETVRRLSLNLMECPLTVICVTSQGIPVNVKGCVIFKIGDTYAEIANAARRFRGQENVIMNQVNSIFDGHLRAIVGNMTMEKLLVDRDELRDNVRHASGTEMANLGLKIDSLQLLSIEDPTGYIELIKAPFVAETEAKARIAKAQQDQAATQQEQASNVAMSEARTTAAKRQAELDAEAQSAQKKAAQAGPLADAIARQQVVEAETRTAELEADRTAKRLETEVRKPADAEAYAAKVRAEGQRDAAIAIAEAEAQRVKLDAAARAQKTQVEAEAQAGATRATGIAEADATKARGIAEAEATKAKGLAEAEAMDKRADALNKGKDALISQQIAEKLPAIVAELVRPYAAIDKLTVLNGAEGMSQMVVGGLDQLSNVLPSLLSAVGVNKALEPKSETEHDVLES